MIVCLLPFWACQQGTQVAPQQLVAFQFEREPLWPLRVGRRPERHHRVDIAAASLGGPFQRNACCEPDGRDLHSPFLVHLRDEQHTAGRPGVPVGATRGHLTQFVFVELPDALHGQRFTLPHGPVTVLPYVHGQVQAEGLVQVVALCGGQSKCGDRGGLRRGREAFDQAAQQERLPLCEPPRGLRRSERVGAVAAGSPGDIEQRQGVRTADLCAQTRPVTAVLPAFQVQGQVTHLPEGSFGVEQVEVVVPGLEVRFQRFCGEAVPEPLGGLFEVVRSPQGAVQQRERQAQEGHGDQGGRVVNPAEGAGAQE